MARALYVPATVTPQAPAIRVDARGDRLHRQPVGVALWQAGGSSPGTGRTRSKESVMSVYRVTEIIGTSSTSWEDAAAQAIRTAAETLRDLRVAEVVKQDIHLDEGGAITYRTKLQLSFKYESDHWSQIGCFPGWQAGLAGFRAGPAAMPEWPLRMHRKTRSMCLICGWA
jgi:dodecin